MTRPTWVRSETWDELVARREWLDNLRGLPLRSSLGSVAATAAGVAGLLVMHGHVSFEFEPGNGSRYIFAITDLGDALGGTAGGRYAVAELIKGAVIALPLGGGRPWSAQDVQEYLHYSSYGDAVPLAELLTLVSVRMPADRVAR